MSIPKRLAQKLRAADAALTTAYYLIPQNSLGTEMRRELAHDARNLGMVLHAVIDALEQGVLMTQREGG